MLFTEQQAREIMQKALRFSKADECVVNLQGYTSGNIRYANNAVSTSGENSNSSLVVTSAFGKKTGIATINEFDDASLEKAVRRSEELAQLAPENPEYMPILGPQKYQSSNAYFKSTADFSPQQRADAAAASILPARERKLKAAGYLQHNAGFQAMLNSKGLFAYHPSTSVEFSVTARNEAGTGSGYASRGYNDISKLNTAQASKIAMDKAEGSAKAVALEPGKYTVILEPAAVAVLLENMFFNMDARSADEGRSFMSKQGGKTKIGEKLVDAKVNIYSDPTHPELPAATWSGDGRPVERVNWIENGVVKNLYASRYWAENKGAKSIPMPNNAIMEGGKASLEDMIKNTKRGILVTRLWYIRSVDPQTLLLTGLTRDGTFLIENGKIKHPVKNFRFNESPIIMLNNLEEMGRPERVVSGESNVNYILPPLKVRDFTFSSLSDAV
ncbi:TldD/PmbA family protein [Pontibacter ramchanderi]|uniref:Putative Zn-dependent protease n=1 Tax=Pontibacter ramchanderi TaxID=1179743 RepID=A0A2N3U8A1_9BACT|nr:TldD/PmbA family protein [Pontibacter ramchanderi]PKV62966.1 putative Zn-dependent protease [Pontibacter ramchanderi]